MFEEFFKQFNGYSLDYDGAYGGQCFDLIQAWNRDWLKCPNWITGEYAYQIFGQLPNYYDSIANTPDGVPQKGDIVVWGKAYNGFAGHTGVATGVGDVNTFQCFEQNDPTGSVCHNKTYNYNYVTGWLRFKGGVPNTMANMYKGLDLSNVDSMKAVVDLYDKWRNGGFVEKTKYDADLQAAKNANQPAPSINDPKADTLRRALKDFLS